MPKRTPQWRAKLCPIPSLEQTAHGTQPRRADSQLAPRCMSKLHNYRKPLNFGMVHCTAKANWMQQDKEQLGQVDTCVIQRWWSAMREVQAETERDHRRWPHQSLHGGLACERILKRRVQLQQVKLLCGFGGLLAWCCVRHFRQRKEQQESLKSERTQVVFR